MNHFKEALIQAPDEPRALQTNPTTSGTPKTKADQYANLTIRVQKRQRLHWLIEAKKQGTSLTSAITDALNERFGKAD